MSSPSVTDETPPRDGQPPKRFSATLYVTVVLCALVLGLAAKLRVEGIFSCPAGHVADGYLAYCQAPGYGDYDHGGLWFGYEPAVADGASRAQVLFVGSSRMEFGFSTEATRSFFRSLGATFYLLGFSYTENVTFLEPLLQRIEPRAKVYVVNVDRFFSDTLTEPGAIVFNESDARSRYAAKRRWQAPHRMLCSTLPSACGNHVAFFRDRTDGTWQLEGSEVFVGAPVSDGSPALEERWPAFMRIGEEFVSSLPVSRECVLLTIVPYRGTRRDEAAAIASHLGLDLISPLPDGLSTIEGSHLTPASAERWSAAFFEAAGDRIRRCLNARSG